MKKISLLLLFLLSTTTYSQETLRERFRERMLNRMEQRKEQNNINVPIQIVQNSNNNIDSANTQTSLPPGVKKYSINVNGETRYYYEYMDSHSFDNKDLLLVYHGGGGSAEKFMSQTKFINLVEKKHLVVVYLNAEDKNWFDGRTGMESRKDIDFTNAIISNYKKNGVSNKVMATGFSNGAIFTLRLACENNTDIKFFAAMSGSFPTSLQCNAKNDRKILMMNGTADNFVKWNGGEIPHSGVNGVGGAVMPVPDTLNYWTNKNQCVLKKTPIIDNNGNDNSTVEKDKYDCVSGKLIFYKINGGGHTIPGGVVNPKMARLVGQTNDDIVAEKEIMDFFD